MKTPRATLLILAAVVLAWACLAALVARRAGWEIGLSVFVGPFVWVVGVAAVRVQPEAPRFVRLHRRPPSTQSTPKP